MWTEIEVGIDKHGAHSKLWLSVFFAMQWKNMMHDSQLHVTLRCYYFTNGCSFIGGSSSEKFK